MKSFFSRLQSKFDASYGGRYVELILQELSREDELVARILGRTTKRCYLETEYTFKVNGRNRIADIAILTEDDHQLIALVEIKYDDHKSPTNAAQIEDYIQYCKSESCHFCYLTQYSPAKRDIDLIKESGCSHLLFSNFSSQLADRSQSQLVKLFIEYLEDKGLSMKTVDSENLYKYLVRLFNPVSKQGKIQSNYSMVDGIPNSFQSLMNNISVISQELSQAIESKRSPVIDFRLWPYFKFSKKEIKEMLEGDQIDANCFLSDNNKNGGELLAFARSIIIDKGADQSDWLYVEYGYKLVIKKGEKEFVTHLYAHVYGKDLKEDNPYLYIEKNLSNETISKKEKSLKHFYGLISSACDKAVSKSSSKTYINALNKTMSGVQEYM